jgi:hypothetical protein
MADGATATLKNAVKPLILGAMRPVVHRRARRTDRTLSAMFRVRDEEEYLERSVLSIVDDVDEIVIVDNLSTDSTPAIIGELVRRHPDKVRSYTYPYEVARQGDENAALAAEPGGLKSPRLLANFYNWCLDKCTMGYILKWDGDMIATPEFSAVCDEFRRSSLQLVHFTGVNLHENRTHLIKGRPIEDTEPRFFRRVGAHYDNGFVSCERLVSPFEFRFAELSGREKRLCYVHMKYCKSIRYTSMSEDMVREALEWASVGPPIDESVRATIERWHL